MEIVSNLKFLYTHYLSRNKIASLFPTSYYFLLLPTSNELKLYFAGSAKAEHGRSGLTLFSHYCKLGDACEKIDLH